MRLKIRGKREAHAFCVPKFTSLNDKVEYLSLTVPWPHHVCSAQRSSTEHAHPFELAWLEFHLTSNPCLLRLKKSSTQPLQSTPVLCSTFPSNFSNSYVEGESIIIPLFQMSKLRFLEVTDFKVMRECGSDCFKERLG
jgi:hypothetical protein